MSLFETLHYQNESIVRELPVNLNKKDIHLFQVELKKKLKLVDSITLKNATVLSNGISTKNKILFELYSNGNPLTLIAKFKLLIKFLIATCKAKRQVHIDGAILVTDYTSDGFFHWFADVLQKLEAIDLKTPQNMQFVFLIPESCNLAYVDESLRPYGIKYQIIDNLSRVTVGDLLCIPQVAPTGNYRGELMRSMRSRFNKFYNVEPQNKRVYITRNKAVKRKIQNEIEIVSILKDNDFLIVAMEELSFYEQYKLVAESDVLISLHGAGLTHMLWMAANSKVMEIRLKDDTHNNCYFSLASDLNLKYFYTLAEKTHEQLSTQDTDFIVDVDDFNLSIQELLKA